MVNAFERDPKSSRMGGVKRALRKKQVDELGDVELIELTRSGDTNAFAVLWRRHEAAGRAVARRTSQAHDPEDIVSEAFTRILSLIRRGMGPQGAFRPYFLSTVHNTAISLAQAQRDYLSDQLDSFADPATLDGNDLAALDQALTVRAFTSLSTQWQEALWYSEVERLNNTEIAKLLGIKANAVAALTFRAREGLRRAWIQAHISAVPEDSECRWAIGQLGGSVRKSLAVRDNARLGKHLETCERCTRIAEEVRDVSSRLALGLLPLLLGAAAAGYAAWLQGGGVASASASAISAPSGAAPVGATPFVAPVIATNAKLLAAGMATVMVAGGAVSFAMPMRTKPETVTTFNSHSGLPFPGQLPITSAQPPAVVPPTAVTPTSAPPTSAPPTSASPPPTTSPPPTMPPTTPPPTLTPPLLPAVDVPMPDPLKPPAGSTLVLLSPLFNDTVFRKRMLVAGTGEADGTVSITIDGVVILASVPIDASGCWAVWVDSPAAGDHSIEVTQTASDGSVSVVSSQFTVDRKP